MNIININLKVNNLLEAKIKNFLEYGKIILNSNCPSLHSNCNHFRKCIYFLNSE